MSLSMLQACSLTRVRRNTSCARRAVDAGHLAQSHPRRDWRPELYTDFNGFSPRNNGEYFVSYFDYYLPEAHIPRSNPTSRKSSSINEEIKGLRPAHSCGAVNPKTCALIQVPCPNSCPANPTSENNSSAMDHAESANSDPIPSNEST